MARLIKSPEHAPNTHLSQRRTALALGMKRGSVRNITKQLGLKPVRKVKVHKLPRRLRETETVEHQRMRLFRQLLRIPRLEERVVMTDEKQFSLVASLNSQNQRVLYSRPES